MGVTKQADGKFVVSRRLPQGGGRIRLKFDDEKSAKNTNSLVEAAIVTGTWKELKEKLSRKKKEEEEKDPTLREFWPDYIAICEATNRRPDFKKHHERQLLRILGKVRLKDLGISDARKYIKIRRRTVQPATVNRGLAVLKNLLTVAVEEGIVPSNPLLRVKRLMLVEEETALRIMTLQEARRLVDAVAVHNPVIAALVALLNETGMRFNEGLRLTWSHISLRDRMLTVAKSKPGKTRRIPLTKFAVEWLMKLQRHEKEDHVFQRDGKVYQDIRWPFHKGRKDAGLDWVRVHDLRHFRATQWIMQGVDLLTVKELLGHATIKTTERYLHFVASHARESLARVERLEREILKREESGNSADQEVC